MRWVLRTILAILLLLVLLLSGIVIGLNSAPGRHFAEQEINRFAGPGVRISGLAGHFPADIKLQSLTLADAGGPWLQGDNLELRWRPLQLLHHDAYVQILTASSIDFIREPISSGKPSSSNRSSTTLPNLRLNLDAINIGALSLPASLAGENITLRVHGSAHLQDFAHGDAALDATTPDGTANYRLATTIDPKNVNLTLRIAEPPNGPLGHLAGPKLQAPLKVDVTLTGPRNNAALNFTAALGNAQLLGNGTLGLDPAKPFADLTLSTPELAPFSALAGSTIGGAAQLHLRVARSSKNAATLALNGEAALRQAPANLGTFLGARDTIALQARLADNALNISQLDISGANFAAHITGKVSQTAMALTTSAEITQVATLSPKISGNVSEQGSITGTFQDFSAHTTLTGRISANAAPSDPFNIVLNVDHLPHAPTGTVSGNGMLENATLALDAAFSRGADGTAHVTINKSSWRSLSARAVLQLPPNALLPFGTAMFSVGRLQDLAPFLPVKLAGAARGDFAYSAGRDVKLNLTTQGLTFSPTLGPINGSLAALGPIQALSVKTAFTVAKVQGSPARLALTGVFNLPEKSAHLASFSGAWRGLNPTLQGPADIATQPQIAVHHLNLTLSGAHIALDGTLYPQLNANASVQNLPVSLAKLFAPAVAATGTLSGTATLTGPPASPNGKLTLQAQALHLQQGAAAALPPADITASAILNGQSANLGVQLNAGQDIALNVQGQAPLQTSAAMNLHLRGRVDMRLLDIFLAAQGTDVRGEAAADLQLTGTPQAPVANGSLTLRNGSVENIASGLNLTQITADIAAAGRNLTLQDFTAAAGHGSITGHGTASLAGAMPVNMSLTAASATPISSDILTETLNGTVNVTGTVRGNMTVSGNVNIAKADINIPHGLPPSVADLPIINAGEPPPPPAPPPPPITLAVDVRARNQIFVRGDGLFAELGGHLRIGGTMASPDPEGGFTLIRGTFSLAGTSLQFTQGTISFTGAGFTPTLDLEATASSATVTGATLTVGGTAAKPVITLSSTPPMPSDEILATLLFGQSTASLTPFQAASLAAALAQISGIGGGGLNPLDKVRSALGLDQLSVGGTGTGPPSLQAGRYVMPGVYVGATQAANGQGTQVNVQINLYKGLQLQTSTSTGSGNNSSSVGLRYQFNY